MKKALLLGFLFIVAFIVYAKYKGKDMSIADIFVGDNHTLKVTPKSLEITTLPIPQKKKENIENKPSKSKKEVKSQKNQSININSLEKLIKSFNPNSRWWEENPANFKKIEEDKKKKQITVLIDFLDKRNMIYTYELDDSFSKIIKKINQKPIHVVNVDKWEEEWEKNLIIYSPERKIDTPNGQLHSKIPKISEKNYKDKLSIDNAYGYIYTKEGQFFITYYSYTTFKTNGRNPIWIYKLRGQ